MSINSALGVILNKPKKLSNLYEYFFGEDQGRYVVEVDRDKIEKIEKILNKNNIYYEIIGKTQKDFFELEDEMKINVEDMSKINNNLPIFASNISVILL